MGKKRKGPDLEELLARPICFYCERDFDDLAVLINHQKAKHFRCQLCNKRLHTSSGLQVHMQQVHKAHVDKIENALSHREELYTEIFGEEGVPEQIKNGWRLNVMNEFYKRENEHRVATGNPLPGSQPGENGPRKKPKLESAEETKKRIAEFKAKKAAEREAKANGTWVEPEKSSAGNTPEEKQDDDNTNMQGVSGYSMIESHHSPTDGFSQVEQDYIPLQRTPEVSLLPSQRHTFSTH